MIVKTDVANMIVVLLIFVATMCLVNPVLAQDTGVTRSIDGSVSPYSEFDVVLTISGIQVGGIVETLPEGFTYVGTSLPDTRVDVSGRQVIFSIIDDETIAYQVKTPGNGRGTITGVWDDAVSETNGTIAGTAVSATSDSNDGGDDDFSSSPSIKSTGSTSAEFKILKGEKKTLEFSGCDISAITISVERGTLDGTLRIRQSSTLSGVPAVSGSAYHYLTPEGTDTGDANISAEIQFSVNRSWIENHQIDPSTITLYQYAENWTALKTTLTGEDDDVLHFTAVSTGISTFAISGEPKPGATKTAPTTETTKTVTTSASAGSNAVETVKVPTETTPQKSPAAPYVTLTGLCVASLLAAHTGMRRKKR